MECHLLSQENSIREASYILFPSILVILNLQWNKKIKTKLFYSLGSKFVSLINGSQLEVHLVLLCFVDIVGFVFLFCFFTNWRFVAMLCWASLFSAIFLTAFAHVMSLHHVLVILAILQTSSSLLYLLWWTVISDQWSLMLRS